MKKFVTFLTWEDVVFVHRAIQKGTYRSEKEIFEREAQIMNNLINIRIDSAKETRRRARQAAPKPGATKKIQDKRSDW